MSRKISYKGILDMGTQDRIKLSTAKGKTGYKITKFQIVAKQAGAANSTFVAQITKTDKTGSITSDIDFTDSSLLAVIYQVDASSVIYPSSEVIIFDNESFNQDIFINITDPDGGTNPCNYYIELETMPLSDIEATMLTLKSIRTLTS